MTYLLSNNDQTFIGTFGETKENQFSLLVTNCKEFFIENLSLEVLMDRIMEMNESIRYKQSKVLKVLRDEKPESCTINNIDDSIRIDMKFVVNNNRPMNVYFLVARCDSMEIGPLFVCGLMKSLMEKSLMIEKMCSVIDAKEKESDEREQNGGKLIRDNSATVKFNFNAEFLSVKFKENRLRLDPDPIVIRSNVPELCRMIDAENVLDQLKVVKTVQKRLIASQGKSGISTRKFRSQAAPVAKEFGYINEGEDDKETDQSNSSTESSTQQGDEGEKQKDSTRKMKQSKKQIW